MHERPGPNRTGAVIQRQRFAKLKMLRKKNDTKGFETFFSSFFVGEQSLLLSSMGASPP